MKHLKKYKIYESQEVDENDEIPQGFQFSWNDINERLSYLTDIGFVIDEDSKSRYFLDKKGKKIQKEYDSWSRTSNSNTDKIKNAVIEIKLFKKTEAERYHRSVNTEGYVGTSRRKDHYYFDDDIEGVLNIYEEIASFCAHFTKSYHNLTVKHDGFHLWLIVSTDVSEDYVKNKLQKEVIEDTEEAISGLFSRIRYNILDPSHNKYSKRFNDLAFKNKLGARMWSFLGDKESGFMIKPINDTELTKRVKDTNYPKIYQYYNKNGVTMDFRRITDDDLKKIKSGYDETREDNQETVKSLDDRYGGLMGVFIEFDYDKLYDIVLNMDKQDRSYVERAF